MEASSSSNCFAALDLLPDAALSLLASNWGAVDAHASRSSLLAQLRQQLKQSELDPTLDPSLLQQLQLPALFGFSAAVYTGNIYVYGGRSSSDTASSGVRSHLYCYDIAQQKWAAIKQYNAPAPRRQATLGQQAGPIQGYSMLHSFDLESGCWSMRGVQLESCIALLNDLLLVSGGARPVAAGAEQALLPDLAFLHLPSKKWHSLQLPASSKPARACHAAAVMPGSRSICLLGGWHESWPQPAPSLSPVFEAMLLPGGMSEADSGCVALPDVSSAALEALLGYMYGGLHGGVPRELVLELFSAADRFLLPGLAGECVLQLLGCLSAENVSLVADLASTHRLQELWQACVSYAASPEVQLQVFNSAAYAAMWRDSASTAQAFTAQVAALSQQALSRMKQQLPATGAADADVAKCLLPPLQQAGDAAAGLDMLAPHARGIKRQHTD
ncbi:hypothetical protein COO60DRAFT_1462202 [Scenedesmus sp. NREL 46B-D3]|nr:hypothetical protein COO60DRAFT_1462202 [Scenedesmus sp. NREL 46B-D3]